MPRSRRARSRPRVTVVLPLPEAGAAISRPPGSGNFSRLTAPQRVEIARWRTSGHALPIQHLPHQDRTSHTNDRGWFDRGCMDIGHNRPQRGFKHWLAGLRMNPSPW